jgi:hypothetical protein
VGGVAAPEKLRLTAYVLLGDPHYLAASIASYYAYVSRIVACHDADGLSWSGEPLDLDTCLAEVRAADPAGKVDVVTGHFSAPDRPLLESDTRQRQVALDAASDNADWVLQLDTDEVALDAGRLVAAVSTAATRGYAAVDYPSRWLFARRSAHRYVELSSRWGRPAMTYPGPLAVRAGTHLTLARQQGAARYRLDVCARSTDPAQPASVVHEVVPLSQAVLHFSWVRPREEMLRKSRVSSHARDFDWAAALDRWERSARHPWLYALGNPIRRYDALPGRWLRPTTLPVDPPMLAHQQPPAPL